MHVVTLASCKKRERAGLMSYILLEKSDIGDSLNITITWVELSIGGGQKEHSHEAQQVYVVTSGTGLMKVGPDTESVGPGSLVFIPPWQPHSLVNTGNTPLIYLSASHPAFDVTKFYDEGPLGIERAADEAAKRD